MPRRRAFRLAGGALALAAVESVPGVAFARGSKNCPGVGCHYPNGGCPGKTHPCQGTGSKPGNCCSPTATCCDAGADGPGGCCPVGSECQDGACVSDVCKWTEKETRRFGPPKEVEESKKYDPATQCCTKTGVEPKNSGWDYTACQPTLARRPGFKPKAGFCGPAGARVPDGYKAASFLPACGAHDLCYSKCGMTQSDCDTQFRADLLKICEKTYPPTSPTSAANLPGCISLAETYHGGVRYFGTNAFLDAQREACTCCK
jgi:hypothetical protein